MPAGKQFPLLIFHRINAVHHGLVGRKNTVGIVIILLLHQVGTGQIRQHIHKTSFRLRHQRIPVRQEQNIFDPARLQKNFAQSDNRSRLTRSGGHDKQRFPAVFLIKTVTHRPDGRLLIVASRDVLIH